MVSGGSQGPAGAGLASFNDAASRENVMEAFAEDVIAYDWMVPGREIHGKDALYREFFAPIYESFPDVEFRALDTIVAADKLVIRGEFHGTFMKDYIGLKPHGRRVRWTAHDIYQMKDGKIVCVWFGNDTLTVARQLGAFPDDGQPW